MLSDKENKLAVKGFQSSNIRLGIKLDFIVPVIGPYEVVMVLSHLGYNTITNSANPEQIQGEKLNATVYVDNGKRIIGVHSATVEDSVNSIEDVLGTIQKIFAIDLHQYINFYEFEINASYYIDNNNAYSEISKLYSDSKDLSNFNEIIGQKLSQSSIKLTPYGKHINNLEWYEITIEPKINSPGNAFAIRMICRNPNLRLVIENAKSTPENISKIIAQILQK